MAYYDFARVKDRIKQYEYNQAVSNQLPLEINSYAEALDWWKRRNGEEYQGSNDRPIAKREWGDRRMRMRRDKSIEFEYDKHVLCVWHPDQTLTVDPFPTSKYGAFERYVMPRTLEVGLGARTGKVIYLKPNDIDVRAKITMDTDTGVHRMTNPDILVIRAESPVNLRLVRDTNRWEPINEFKIKPFYWYELNRGELREASLRYNFADFIAAIQAALSMGAEIPMSKAFDANVASRTNAEGKGVLELLEEGRLVDAAALVRPSETRYYDTVNGKWVVDANGLNSTDIKKIRHMAYQEMGLLYLESERCVTLPQFNNIETKLRDFGLPA